MLALPVDIDEQRADLRQDRHRRRSTVQPGATSPSGVNFAAENEQTVALVDLELLEHSRQSITMRHAVQIKCGVDRSRCGSRPHHIGADSIAEDRPQSVDQNRLSGAGFSGQHIQTRSEGNLDGLDNGEIADGEFDEHGLESLVRAPNDCPASRSPPQYAIAESRPPIRSGSDFAAAMAARSDPQERGHGAALFETTEGRNGDPELRLKSPGPRSARAGT